MATQLSKREEVGNLLKQVLMLEDKALLLQILQRIMDNPNADVRAEVAEELSVFSDADLATTSNIFAQGVEDTDANVRQSFSKLFVRMIRLIDNKKLEKTVRLLPNWEKAFPHRSKQSNTTNTEQLVDNLMVDAACLV